jgi:predicted ATPase
VPWSSIKRLHSEGCAVPKQSAVLSDDYRMIKNLSVQNFRCFKKVELTGLGIINLIVGPNGSGKTALLEAIFIHLGSGGQVGLALRQQRGLGQMLLTGITSANTTNLQSMWTEFFHHFDDHESISISSDDTNRGHRELAITYQPNAPLLIPAGDSNQPSATPLNFVFRVPGKRDQTVQLEFTEKGLQVGAIKDTVPSAFVSTGHIYGSESADRFSALSKVNRSQDIVDAVRAEFPAIESLSVEVLHGSPTLYAYMPSVPEAKLPIELVSAGINKYLNLLTGIATNRRGVLMVDELENGFYYAQLPSLCRGLLTFCKKFDTQIFASTHSRELLGAMAKAGDEKDICLLRSRKKNGYCDVQRFSGIDMKAALEQAVEFR